MIKYVNDINKNKPYGEIIESYTTNKNITYKNVVKKNKFNIKLRQDHIYFLKNHNYMKKKYINSDKLLETLISNKHDNLLKIFDFNNKYIYMENIQNYKMLYNHKKLEKPIYYENSKVNKNKNKYDHIKFYFNDNRKITKKQIEIIKKQLENGLQFLHNLNIYHGDLYPNNIVINDDLQLKIIDYDASFIIEKDVINFKIEKDMLKKIINGLYFFL